MFKRHYCSFVIFGKSCLTIPFINIINNNNSYLLNLIYNNSGYKWTP